MDRWMVPERVGVFRNPLMSRVLSIQSHVVHGYVGNKAASFPLQVLGYEVDSMNTVQFSNHTGYPKFTGMRFDKAHFASLFEGLIHNGLVFGSNLSHILMGYVGNTDSLMVIHDYVKKIKAENKRITILIDPVLGDNGKLYCPEECIKIYREMLCLADIITPNGSEAIWLANLPLGTSMIGILDQLHVMGPSQVIVTSVSVDEELYLYASCSRENKKYKIRIPKFAGHFTGTGDTFSALILAHLNKHPIKEACQLAVDTMLNILKNTVEIRGGPGELAIVQSIKEIQSPSHTIEAQLMD